MAIQSCRRCSSQIAPGEEIQMWDGQTYCQPCVVAVDEALVTNVKANAALEETLPTEAVAAGWAYVRDALGVCFWAACGIGLLHGSWFLRGIPIGGATPIYVVVGGLLAFAAIGSAPIYVAAAARRKLPRTIRLRDGRVWVGGPSGETSFPLGDFRWFMGSLRQGRRGWHSRDWPAIILERRDNTWVRFACGVRPPARRQWQAVLTLADLPRAPDRTYGQERWMIRAIVATGTIGGGIIGFLGGSLVNALTDGGLWHAACAFATAFCGFLTAREYVHAREGWQPKRPPMGRLLPWFIFAGFFVYPAGSIDPASTTANKQLDVVAALTSTSVYAVVGFAVVRWLKSVRSSAERES